MKLKKARALAANISLETKIDSTILGALVEKDIRYMDNILILTKTRWQNRLKPEKHPDKTFIGKIEKGFDFLGYHFSREFLKVAEKVWGKHDLHIIPHYERLRQKKATSFEMASTLGLYVKR